MIIKNNTYRISLINKVKRFVSKLIFFIGIATVLLFSSVIFYYYNSGMSDRYNPYSLIKKFDQVILDKYIGFSIFEIDDYLKIKLKLLKFILIKNKLENISIEIDQKNIYKLELQRSNRLSGNNTDKEFASAKIKTNKKEYDIKLRVKGDRLIHWREKDKTSYKVDIKGEDRIWGLEEFSIQKPITRNYMYEFIFHRLLKESGLISLKYFFVNISINDNKQGIYAVEEGFSKELIERNKKRNGPIFGLDEDYDDHNLIYPNVKYDMYSKEFWINNYPKITESALFKLNKLKEGEVKINEIFDMEKWATFFAIIDLSRTYHGSLAKSVKLYYNPVTAKFEPIGFDGHVNQNLFKDFLIYDFMDEKNINCSYLCKFRDWYLIFLKNNDGSNNDEFLNLYINALKKLSSENFLNTFYKNHGEDINFNNSQLLSDNNKKDLIMYEGLGLFILDQNFLFKRSQYINDRLKKIIHQNQVKKNSTRNIVESSNILENNGIEYLDEQYYLIKDLIIDKNYFLSKNDKLNINKGVKIFFEKDTTLISEGAISFNGTAEKPIFVFSDKGYGSLILSNNSYEIKNTIFKNLSFPKSIDKILYGGLNIINSNLRILDSEINNSNSEDAINIISSKSYIENLKINNSFADAIDIDFGELVFNNIICKNISNDCLDVSGGTVKGVKLRAIDVSDKGLSFGENSIGSFSEMNFKSNRLAIAVKDGSKLSLTNFSLSDNEYDIAVFNKKKEYGGSEIELELEDKKSIPNILLGKNNKIISNHNTEITKLSNKYINSLFY